MLLALDIGNTNITAGAFDGKRQVASWRLATDKYRSSDEYSLQLGGLLPLRNVQLEQINEIAICSVVPPLTPVLEEAVRTLFRVQPLIVGAGTRTGVRVLYDSPRDVGADRVVNAAATFHFYGGPAIVVDFGTATVFDAIAADGSYLGGAIAPGLSIAAESLFLSTSQLRRVELIAPPTAIGKNTVHSMQSGLVLGYIGLVESMVRQFRDELKAPDAKVIATGGLAHVIAPRTTMFNIVDEELTLRGLQYIHTMNIAEQSEL